MKKEFIITDPVGLHARPATHLVNEAGKYASDAKIIVGEKEANLKSIMGVMSLAVASGQEFVIEFTGEDEEAAMTGIEKVISENGIGESK
ncbi:MAG: HPr family phosphocarrier protein [Mycoplasmatales bacterium]